VRSRRSSSGVNSATGLPISFERSIPSVY
jgi:hypothetical protein